MRAPRIPPAARAALLLLLGLLGPLAPARAQDGPTVVVTPGSARTFRLALQRFAAEGAVADPRGNESFAADLRSALDFSGVFALVDEAAFLAPVRTTSLDRPDWVCSDWSQIGADVLVEGEITRDPEQLAVRFHAWDTASCSALVRKRYRQAADAAADSIAKRIADDVVEAFLGVRGVAATEIAFVSDRGGNPEIFVMDADGGRARAATTNGSINAFPNWSPTGDAILYTSYRHRNRPHLFLSTRGAGRPGLVLDGLVPERQQYRGVFHPSGRNLAAVLALDGSSEIYTVRVDGSGLRQLTRNGAIDLSPTWSPDGSRLAFVSDRSGSPQIYLMDARGGGQRRLSYTGDYNTSPAWSPDGRWIAYETRVSGQFDIWLLDPESGSSVPLVTHPRSDEAPSWAPNGRKLAFHSTRRGPSDIYVVDLGGDTLWRLTRGAGENKSPSWGPFLR